MASISAARLAAAGEERDLDEGAEIAWLRQIGAFEVSAERARELVRGSEALVDHGLVGSIGFSNMRGPTRSAKPADVLEMLRRREQRLACLARKCHRSPSRIADCAP